MWRPCNQGPFRNNTHCVFRQQLVFGLRQELHFPHWGIHSGITLSPGFSSVTCSPTLSTIPAPSWPRITGKHIFSICPCSAWSSVRHIPELTIFIRTSWAFGGCTSISSMVSGWFALQATAALHCITCNKVMYYLTTYMMKAFCRTIVFKMCLYIITYKRL